MSNKPLPTESPREAANEREARIETLGLRPLDTIRYADHSGRTALLGGMIYAAPRQKVTH